MRSDEEKFLANRIYDDFRENFPNGASVSDLVEAIRGGEIALQFNKKEGTKVIDEECVGEIRKVVPYIQRIIEKPRSFIKSMEEKIPVETAKRISHNAIMHLGRDSNDWYARTFITVKPKRIISDINEETIDLYENRFVKALIDRILPYVTARRVKLENLYNMGEDERILDFLGTRINYMRVQAKNDRLLKSLMKNATTGEYTDSRLSSDLEEVRELERKIIALKYSDFYNRLRKCRKVRNPIAKTNILLFDANYNRCYMLWEYLNAKHEETNYSLDEYEGRDCGEYYYAYVIFNLIASMYNSGYEELNNPIISYRENTLLISGEMLWVRGNTRLKISLAQEEKRILLSLLPEEENGKRDNFEIYSDFTNFEGQGRPQIEEITSKIISFLTERDKQTVVSGKYCFVCMDINACSASNDLGERLYRRLFNIGDNYSKDETDLERKGYYQTGIQILSPLDLRYNFLHIQRIINAHVMMNKNLRTMPDQCPLCGSLRIRKGPYDLICYECGHRISHTKCSNCKKQDLLWIKFSDDSALKEKDITDTVQDKPYYFQLMKYETIMGEYAVSSFRLVEEITGWKLKSICPNCGVVLGDVDQEKTNGN